jgi:hypothetical protein
MANISGQTLGRYKILEVLGEGRMASRIWSRIFFAMVLDFSIKVSIMIIRVW